VSNLGTEYHRVFTIDSLNKDCGLVS
jgi:hypothetical protein